MDPRTANRLGNLFIALFAVALLWLVWGWWSFTGLYRFIAVLSLRFFGSYGVFSTLLMGLALLEAVFFAVATPVIRRTPPSPAKRPLPTRAEAEAKVWRGFGRAALVAGCVALLITLGAVAVQSGSSVLRVNKRQA